jgi:hypothetical protein
LQISVRDTSKAALTPMLHTLVAAQTLENVSVKAFTSAPRVKLLLLSMADITGTAWLRMQLCTTGR